MFSFVPTEEMLAALDPESRAMWEKQLQAQAEQALHIEQLAADRNFHQALALCESQHRAAKLVDWDEQYGYTDDEARQLITDWWSSTEAWSGDERLRDGMYGLLTRVSPLHVTGENALTELLYEHLDTLTVYRGNLGETPGEHISSWTLDLEVAQRFANMAGSMRGMFLGMWREDGVPTIWQAEVDRAEVLAYFDDRDEQEVVLPGGKVRNVKMLAQAERKEEK